MEILNRQWKSLTLVKLQQFEGTPGPPSLLFRQTVVGVTLVLG